MNIEKMIFYGFSSLAIVSAISMIFSKNPVRSLLSLALSFLFMVPVWFLLKSEFLAMILILVYVGAIMVLFLFVIMMVNLTPASKSSPSHSILFLGIGVSTILASFFFFIFKNSYVNELKPALFSLKDLAFSLQQDFLYPLEIAGVLLLVALIAALELNPTRKITKSFMRTAEQLNTSKYERLRIIKGVSSGREADLP